MPPHALVSHQPHRWAPPYVTYATCVALRYTRNVGVTDVAHPPDRGRRPQVSVVLDKLTYGDAVNIAPPAYWTLFGGPHAEAAAAAVAAAM